jgi:serine/threonine protein kinase
MSKASALVGQGSYGCVFRPPINCVDSPNTNMDQKVSKVLTTDNANKEFDEYNQIARADPNNEYYLGKPQKCSMSEADYKAFVERSGCRILQPNSSYSDYRLLQYLDGGSDLDDFARVHLTKFLSTWPRRQSDYFWLNAHKLFMGLKQFATNNVIHDDLKPQNIVFKFDLAKDTMDFNFIDFGLAKNLSSLRMNVETRYVDRVFHWSRPLEQGFASNKLHLDDFAVASDDEITAHFTKEFTDIILQNKKKNRYGIRPDSFLLLHEYVSDSMTPNTNVIVEERIKSAMQGMMVYRNDVDAFCRKTINTTDSYSLGFSLNHVANKMHKTGAIPDNEYIMYHQFFEKLFDFNLFTRLENIDMIINEYESVLELNGVLQRLGKRFVNHNVEKKDYTNLVKAVLALNLNRAKVVAASSPSDSSASSSLAAMTPCPPGKERNPFTRRCVKVCAAGQTRVNGRCKKTILTKTCPPGKEINPDTGRCIKVCPAGQTRVNGRCKKVPKVKTPTPSCPPGKERNPDTGRCIKVCPAGKTRRNGRCVKS